MGQPDHEQTLVLIKPDALILSLTGYILSQLSEFHTGLRLAATKIVHPSRMLAEEHYAEHRGKSFYPALIDYITGKVHYPDAPDRRRVVAIVYSGPGAVQKIRDISGPTSPHVAREKAPGVIRALGTVVPVKNAAGQVVAERLDNLVHASATPAEADREIKLWFRPADMMPFMWVSPTAIAEEHFYFSEHTVSTRPRPGARLLVGPGDTLWRSDLEALQALSQGKPAQTTMEGVVAKYFINTAREEG
jgi:nucleoside-diphosphate kinase